MKIFCGILFLIFGICNLVMTYITIADYEDNLKNKITVWVSTICAGFCFGIALDDFGVINPQRAFPAKEYHISIKTTTIDNQTDTTYVITERSNTH